ncbi:MAG TPA: ABC transporter permease [Bryobacteraceae bacterium]|nr:ABC transporter permease [Bryobacteraceae bacterium]
MPENARWKDEVARRLASLRLPPEREAEIIDELAGHLQDDFRRLCASGVAEPEALEIALEELNGRPALAEAIRRTERTAPSTLTLGTPKASASLDFWRDLRYALRSFRRSPGFTALAVLSLGLGIGGNAAMFGILNAVLIRPLPYAHPDRLVHADHSGYYPPGGVVALQRGSRTMELAGYTADLELNLTGQGEPLRITGSAVSANLFQVLGVGVEVGRDFRPGEDEAGRDNLVILSHDLWRERFAGDRNIIGRVLNLGGVPRQVLGIAPAGFAFPDSRTRFWIPLHLDPRDSSAYWAQGFMPVIGRLRSGATLSQAQQEIASLSREMLRQFPYPMGKDWAAQMTVTPLQQFLRSNIRLELLVLQCALGLVLLIACANVAGLLLGRAISRQKEIALRVALGASRTRIVRQLLTESLVLAFAGGSLGIVIAFVADMVLRTALSATLNGGAPGGPGWQILVFAGVLSLFTGLIFGLAPALIASRQDLAHAIKTGGQRTTGVARVRLRSALIVGEVALAVLLTTSAGLLMRSLWKLAQVDPGFQPEHLLTLRVSPNQSLCQRRDACVALYDEVLRRAREVPGVQDAAAANTLPLAAGVPASAVKVEGLPYVPAERGAPMFWAGAVTPGYFRLMNIPILQGRALDYGDVEKASPVVVVSAATARRYWPGQNPIGKHVELVWEDRWWTVVGVAGDVRQFGLAGGTPDYIRGAMYMSYAQAEDTNRELPAVMALIVRTNGDPIRVVSGIRDVLWQLNPNVPVDEIRSMVSLVNESTQQSRAMMWLFMSFAIVALVLAAIGAYGVVSYATAQRTFEIGVRMALGAARGNIFGSVLGQSFRLVLVGLALGLVSSLLLTRLLATFLYGTGTHDPITLAAVCLVLMAVALFAGYAPARKAVGIDPLIALRSD